MIKENPKTLVAPSLDYIDLKSFKYIAGNPYSELRMRWDMGYMWLGIPKERRRPPTTPIRYTGYCAKPNFLPFVMGLLDAKHKQEIHN